MQVLRAEPDLFDVQGWRDRLARLRQEPPDKWRDVLIQHAEAHLAAIGDGEALPSQMPRKPATGAQ